MHAAIAAYLRGQRCTAAVRRPASETEREATILAIWRERRTVPRCQVCGRPVDDDGGYFNLADMPTRRRCEQPYQNFRACCDRLADDNSAPLCEQGGEDIG